MKLILLIFFIAGSVMGYSQEVKFDSSQDMIQIDRLNEFYLTFHKDSTCTFTPYLNNEQHKITYSKSYHFRLNNPMKNNISSQFFSKYKENMERNIIGPMRYKAKIYYNDTILNLYDKGNSVYWEYINAIVDATYFKNNLRDSLFDFYLTLPDRRVNKFRNTDESFISVKMFKALKNDRSNSKSFQKLLTFIESKYYNKRKLDVILKRIKKNNPEIILSDELTFLWNDKIYFRYPTLSLEKDNSNNLYPFGKHTLTTLKELVQRDKITFSLVDEEDNSHIVISVQ